MVVHRTASVWDARAGAGRLAASIRALSAPAVGEREGPLHLIQRTYFCSHSQAILAWGPLPARWRTPARVFATTMLALGAEDIHEVRGGPQDINAVASSWEETDGGEGTSEWGARVVRGYRHAESVVWSGRLWLARSGGGAPAPRRGRPARACGHIAGGRTTSETALCLGFSETSAFTHACLRWFDSSPRALRAHLRTRP
jgi:AraC-like DNA-binding protein